LGKAKDWSGSSILMGAAEEKAMSNIQEEVAKDQARAVGDSGSSNSGASVAVEQSENQAKPKSAFEQYCDDNPSASECRIYEE